MMTSGKTNPSYLRFQKILHNLRHPGVDKGKGVATSEVPTARDVDSAQATGDPTGGAEAVAEADADTQDFRREGRRTGARLMQRVYEVNPLICSDCGSEMPIVACIDDPAVIRRILEHLHLWEWSPRPPPAPLLGRKKEDLLPDRAPDPEPQPETGFPSDSVFRDDVPTSTD